MPNSPESSFTPKRSKAARSWARDAGFFFGGVVVGSTGTVLLGIATEKVQPEDLGLKPRQSNFTTQGGK